MKIKGQGVAILITIIVIVAAVAGGYYVYTQAQEKGPGRRGAALTSKIPSGVDMVLSADVGSVVGDEDFKELTNEGLQVYSQMNPYADVPSSYQDLLNEFEKETGFGVSKFGGVALFARYPEEALGQGYGGVIFSGDLTESELVSAMGGENLKEDTYNGVTVYKENVWAGWSPEEGPQYEWRIKLGILPDGSYVSGTENAVKDVIGTVKGDKAKFSGSLREEYKKAGSGYLKFAMKVPSEQIPTEQFPPQINAQVFLDIESTSGSFSKSGSTLKFSFRIKASSSSSAGDIKSSIEGLVSLGEGMIANEIIKDELEKISVKQTDSTVSIGYEATVEDIKNLIGALSPITQT